MLQSKRIITIIIFVLCSSAIAGAVRSILVRVFGGYEALIFGICFFIVATLTLMLYHYFCQR